MNTSLTPEQAKRIQQYLETGKHTTVAEIIDEALKLLEVSENKPRRGKKMLEVMQSS